MQLLSKLLTAFVLDERQRSMNIYAHHATEMVDAFAYRHPLELSVDVEGPPDIDYTPARVLSFALSTPEQAVHAEFCRQLTHTHFNLTLIAYGHNPNPI